ncbi:MAG: hypothetical protein AAGF99_06695, partial [Bacteroidota bacterium]
EGEQRPPDAGLGPFDTANLVRLGRLLPDALWWPVALRLTWWEADRPVALLMGGAPHDSPDDQERTRMDGLLTQLRAVRPAAEGVTLDGAPAASRVLLEGKRSPGERWDLTALAPFLDRFS